MAKRLQLGDNAPRRATAARLRRISRRQKSRHRNPYATRVSQIQIQTIVMRKPISISRFESLSFLPPVTRVWAGRGLLPSVPTGRRLHFLIIAQRKPVRAARFAGSQTDLATRFPQSRKENAPRTTQIFFILLAHRERGRDRVQFAAPKTWFREQLLPASPIRWRVTAPLNGATMDSPPPSPRPRVFDGL